MKFLCKNYLETGKRQKLKVELFTLERMTILINNEVDKKYALFFLHLV